MGTRFIRSIHSAGLYVERRQGSFKETHLCRHCVNPIGQAWRGYTSSQRKCGILNCATRSATSCWTSLMVILAMSPTFSTLQYIWAHTTPHSTLRRLHTDMCSSAMESEEVARDEITKRCPPELVLDIARAYLQGEEAAIIPTDLEVKKECYSTYHILMLRINTGTLATS